MIPIEIECRIGIELCCSRCDGTPTTDYVYDFVLLMLIDFFEKLFFADSIPLLRKKISFCSFASVTLVSNCTLILRDLFLVHFLNDKKTRWIDVFNTPYALRIRYLR